MEDTGAAQAQFILPKPSTQTKPYQYSEACVCSTNSSRMLQWMLLTCISITLAFDAFASGAQKKWVEREECWECRVKTG